jgi:membrane associated rhomboid family serine protease
MLDNTPPAPRSEQVYNGVFILLGINLALYVLINLLGLPLRVLYLNHNSPAWFQFITSMFCHANWAHLSGNMFLLYVFGKIVEEEEGVLGVVASYLITGLGANLLSWLLLPPNTVSLGASGAVFGLFAVSVLIKLSWGWRRIIEVIILGQFVISQVVSQVQNLDAQDGVNRIAHLGGAIFGVLLITGLHQLTKRSPKT